MKKAKIIFSSYDSINNPYYGGGGALAIHEVAKRLAKTNSVTIITSRYPKALAGKIDGVNYKRIGVSIFSKLDQIMFHFLLPISVLNEKFDIWFESFTPPFSTSFVPLFTDKPVVGIAQFFNAEEKSKQYKLPFYLVQNLGIKCYQYCITLAPVTKSKILGLSPKTKVFIIPNGVKIPKLSKNVEKNYMLFLGRIEMNQKGLDLLIEAFSKIAKEIKLDLYIAGNGNKIDITRLKNKIKSKKLENRVKFLGRVEGYKKQIVINQSQFLVVPSRFETQGLVALEAISSNKPVIVFDIPGFEWISKNVSIKIPAFSVDKYSQAILKLAKNDKLRQDISSNAKKLAKKYTWENCARSYELLAKKLLK